MSELSLAERIQQSTRDLDTLHAIVHGGADEDVQTENGPVPTIHKRLKSVESDAVGSAGEATEQAEAAARSAESAAQAKADTEAARDQVVLDKADVTQLKADTIAAGGIATDAAAAALESANSAGDDALAVAADRQAVELAKADTAQYRGDASGFATQAGLARDGAQLAEGNAGSYKTDAETAAGQAQTLRNEAEAFKLAAENDAAVALANRQAAEAALDAFDDRWLGYKPGPDDPTTDNDGDSLLIGATYFNNALGVLRYYNGTTWEDTVVQASGFYTKAETDAFLAAKAALTHAHAIAQITGLQAALDGKSSTGHGHTIADIASLQAALDAKAAADHAHAFSALTGKPTTLSGYGITDAYTQAAIDALLAAKAAASHAHAIANVTGLQTALDGKAASSHSHPPDFTVDLNMPEPSTQQTTTHPLGATPKRVEAILVCLEANMGYSAGNIATMNTDYNYGVTCGADGTHVWASGNGYGYAAVSKGGGGRGYFDRAKWKVRVSVWLQ